MKIITFLYAIMLSLFISCTNLHVKNSESKYENNHFISFTDIHFNPFADSTIVNTLNHSEYQDWDSIFNTSVLKDIGTYGEETSYQLFKEALFDMKANTPNPDFIIIAGDFICHDFGERYKHYTGINNNIEMHHFLKKTMKFMVAKISDTFPDKNIFPTLGNNDSYCGDYQIKMNGEYLEMFAELFFPLIDKNLNDSIIIHDLKSNGGFVASNPFDKKHKIISFNSILFTPKYLSNKYEKHCDCEQVNQDSLVNIQLSWLKQQLKTCSINNEKVWLLTHVPPGIDCYSSIKKNKPVSYWEEDYVERFIEIINQYASSIKVTMVGHTHMDDFKVVFNKDEPSSIIHITPSISPVFSNNPAYQVIFYEKTNACFNNYISYNININDSTKAYWEEEYNFNSTYETADFTPDGMLKLYNKLNTDSIKLQKYFEFYPSGSKKSTFITDQNWLVYKCGMVNILEENFVACTKP